MENNAIRFEAEVTINHW